jgi:hypothetical protein
MRGGTYSVGSLRKSSTQTLDNPCQKHLRPGQVSEVFIQLGASNMGNPVIKVLAKRPNRVGVSPHPRMETAPVSETLCFLSSNYSESG